MKRKRKTAAHVSVVKLVLSFLVISSFSLISHAVKAEGTARQSSAQQTSDKRKSVRLKIPKGYLPADFPKHKGYLILEPKRPAGMFIVYPNKAESSAELSNQIKALVGGMFIHDSKAEMNWTTSPLAAHQGITNEVGTMLLATSGKMELQLASYTRTFGDTEIVYGYFAMKHRSGKSKDDDGRSIDSAGNSMKEFDEFWQSISAGK